MDFQVVQDHADHGSVGIGHVHNPLHLAGKIRHGEPVDDVHVAPASGSQNREMLRVPARRYSQP